MMLLRSVTKHVADQNWFAVFIDFLIVVVGVFIGIQVANWNADLGNKTLANEYISRLTVDFENIEQRLKENIQFFDDSIKANNLVVAVISESIEPDLNNQSEFKKALGIVNSSRIPGCQSATYLEMQSAGDINLIKNNALKATLTEYNQTTEIAHKGWKALVDERLLSVKNVDSLVQYEHDKNLTSGNGAYKVIDYDFEGMINSTSYRADLNSLVRIQANNWSLQNSQLIRAQAVLQLLKNLEKH